MPHASLLPAAIKIEINFSTYAVMIHSAEHYIKVDTVACMQFVSEVMCLLGAELSVRLEIADLGARLFFTQFYCFATQVKHAARIS